MATEILSIEEIEARRELALRANHEIFHLAEVAANICDDEDAPKFAGIMSRIKLLTDIIYTSQQLHGPETGKCDVKALERAFKGML
jgi:hypothetical protein